LISALVALACSVFVASSVALLVVVGLEAIVVFLVATWVALAQLLTTFVKVLVVSFHLY
jgi:hypothetical protein